MNIPLSKVLDALRHELKEAQARSDPDNPLIIEDVEVELQTVVTWNGATEGEAKGKVELKVLDFLKLGEAEATFKASGGLERATTQKVKLKLTAAKYDPATGKLIKAQVSGHSKDEPKL